MECKNISDFIWLNIVCHVNYKYYKLNIYLYFALKQLTVDIECLSGVRHEFGLTYSVTISAVCMPCLVTVTILH